MCSLESRRTVRASFEINMPQTSTCVFGAEMPNKEMSAANLVEDSTHAHRSSAVRLLFQRLFACSSPIQASSSTFARGVTRRRDDSARVSNHLKALEDACHDDDLFKRRAIYPPPYAGSSKALSMSSLLASPSRSHRKSLAID